jgi:ribosome-associated protein
MTSADRTRSTPPPDSRELALAAARAADAKGATDVMVLDVGDLVGICGYFVLASASNPRQVKAVVDEVEAQLRDRFDDVPRSVEGAESRRWVLLDYADIVVHVFHTEEREYYRIERLYSDAVQLDWQMC